MSSLIVGSYDVLWTEVQSHTLSRTSRKMLANHRQWLCSGEYSGSCLCTESARQAALKSDKVFDGNLSCRITCKEGT